MRRINIYVISAIGAVSIWGSAFVAIRESLLEFAPGALVLFRWSIASIVISIIYALYRRKVNLPQSSLKTKCFSALVGIIGMGLYTLFLSIGERSICAGSASFIIAQSPVVVAILSRIFLKERVCIRRWIGILISLSGVSLIAYSQSNSASLSSDLQNINILFVIASALCSGIYTTLQKYVVKDIHPVELSFWAMWASVLVMLPFYFPLLLTQLKAADPPELLSALYLGIGPGTAFLLWALATSGMSAIRTASFGYFLPLVTIFFGWLFLSEMPSSGELLGGLIAIIGALIVNQHVKLRSRNHQPI